jgi:putative ATP-dependent endonuclease of the OLD family
LYSENRKLPVLYWLVNGNGTILSNILAMRLPIMLLTELKIENYRGIRALTLLLTATTVLIGENNSGKTTILHALRACLQILRNGGRSSVFDEFDFHFKNNATDPTTADPITLTLSFEEQKADDWTDEIVQQLGGNDSVLALVGVGDAQHYRVQLRVEGKYNANSQEIETSFDFLDQDGNPLPNKNRGRLNTLQQIRPLFYLSALRDASKEFSRSAQFWSPFIKNSQMDAATKLEIEGQLQAINHQIIEAHGTFKDVRAYLEKIQELVALGAQDVISVDAVPARIFDMLSRTQISIASATGARLPIGRHGEGTQSLTVLMLFNAFLKTELIRKSGNQMVKPLVALEEPEAHLHPNAVRALWKTIANIDGQKIVATHSGDLLAEVDCFAIRRLYRSSGVIAVGALPADLFDERAKQKFDYFVRRNRGELFFAKCWLLVEGETDVILLSGAAGVLNLDLEQAGIRIVDYAQSDMSLFLKAADKLGIQWHVFSDGDDAGIKQSKKARDALAGRIEAEHITLLPNNEPIEPLLHRFGFADVYEQQASDQNRSRYIKVAPDHDDYPMQLYQCLPNNGKPAAAHALMVEMKKRGASSVPPELKACLDVCIALARK